MNHHHFCLETMATKKKLWHSMASHLLSSLVRCARATGRPLALVLRTGLAKLASAILAQPVPTMTHLSYYPFLAS